MPAEQDADAVRESRRKGAARENVAREKHRGAAEEPPPAYRILRRLSSAA